MRDLLVSCQEIAREDLLMSRSCGSHLEHSQHRENNAGGSGSGLKVAPALAANAALCAQDDIDSTRCYKALEFVTGCSDIALLEKLRLELPIAVLKEQLQLYDARSLCPRQEQREQREKVTCQPGNLSSRERVCRALDEYRCAWQVQRGDRFPKGLVDEFLNEMVVFTGPVSKHPAKRVRVRFHCWVKDGAPDHSQMPVPAPRELQPRALFHSKTGNAAKEHKAVRSFALLSANNYLSGGEGWKR